MHKKLYIILITMLSGGIELVSAQIALPVFQAIQKRVANHPGFAVTALNFVNNDQTGTGGDHIEIPWGTGLKDYTVDDSSSFTVTIRALLPYGSNWIRRDCYYASPDHSMRAAYYYDGGKRIYSLLMDTDGTVVSDQERGTVTRSTGVANHSTSWAGQHSNNIQMIYYDSEYYFWTGYRGTVNASTGVFTSSDSGEKIWFKLNRSYGGSGVNTNIVYDGNDSSSPTVLAEKTASGTYDYIKVSYSDVSDFSSGNTGTIVSMKIVTTLAGTGSTGSANGTGTAASFYSPQGVAVDNSGNVYVADASNHLIRKITSAGVVTTLAGSGSQGSANGTGTAATFKFPRGVAVDGSGNVYVADRQNHMIRKITSAGVVTTLAGSGSSGSADGTGTAATFYQPCGVAVDNSGNVYVADASNHLIRKITSAGVVTTLAGSGSQGSADGTGTAASFNYPYGIAVDGSGNVYVADKENNLIRKVTSAGVVTTLAGSGSSGSADGTGTAASFYSPYGVAVDNSGNVYVADRQNHMIRKITSAGVVTTLAGSGSSGSADGTGTAASFYQPCGVAVVGSGNVYVADTDNNLIRKITTTGLGSTTVGAGSDYGPAGAVSKNSISFYKNGVYVLTLGVTPDVSGTTSGTGYLGRFCTGDNPYVDLNNVTEWALISYCDPSDITSLHNAQGNTDLRSWAAGQGKSLGIYYSLTSSLSDGDSVIDLSGNNHNGTARGL